nr:hypothetical protein [Tanacetum cinerariifolium]
MTDNQTMAEMLRAPTEGVTEVIVVPSILAEQFELKHSLINMMTSEQFFGLEKDNPHDHIRSGSLPSNTVANPKGKLKAITTRSGLVMDGPTILTPPTSINQKVDEHVEETFTDPDLAEYTIKVPPPPVLKYKPHSQREFILHQRDPLYPNIPYPSRMLKQKQQEKDEVPIQNFWQIGYPEKVTQKLGDPGKFLIPCGFSEHKCKALADLGASINLMPLSVWKKLGLPELISTRMTLELANRSIYTPTEEMSSFRTARALIDVHGEEMILRNDDERLTLNMKHNTASYSNHPHRESANLINSFNVSNIDAFNNIHPHFDDDPLSGSTSYSANSLLEEFTDELALITYPPDYDDNLQFDIESDLEEI